MSQPVPGLLGQFWASTRSVYGICLPIEENEIKVSGVILCEAMAGEVADLLCVATSDLDKRVYFI